MYLIIYLDLDRDFSSDLLRDLESRLVDRTWISKFASEWFSSDNEGDISGTEWIDSTSESMYIIVLFDAFEFIDVTGSLVGWPSNKYEMNRKNK